MGLYLIAAETVSSWATFAFYALLVLIGVNFVILVHELGHFLVARACGVKCEKFYVWFDIFGWKICKFQWGETEYGIGVLPLGGYVKMLGQEDNPARLREEVERAKAKQTASPDDAKDQSSQADEIDIKAAEEALYDPRSYLAKSVPQRMAIISAGVIMNVIFAFVLGVGAYVLGVQQVECAVGAVYPGEAAWRADIRVGDRIAEVAGKPAKRFNDLNREISVGDIQDGVPLVVMRRREDGSQQRLELDMQPDRVRVAPTIGITNCHITTLDTTLPVFPGSSAAFAAPEFHPGDQIVRINEKPIVDYAQIHAELARQPEDRLTVTVRRSSKPADGSLQQQEDVRIQVDPAPMRCLGLVMEMGPITALRDNSPAREKADPPFELGDRITSVADDQGFQWDGDPMTLSDQLRRLAEQRQEGHLVTLTVDREGDPQPLSREIRVPLRRANWYSGSVDTGSPATVPALGIAYHVSNKIRSVKAGSSAANAGLKAGQVVSKATVIPPDQQSLGSEELGSATSEVRQSKLVLEFGQSKGKWPALSYVLQQSIPGTQVELQLEDKTTVTLLPVPSADWFNPDRGFNFEPLAFIQTAGSAGEAIQLGLRETGDSLTLVFRTLGSLGTGQVSLKGLSGPVGIVQMAYIYASRGMGNFLAFLCLISANLAVINFLPIPVLDGGHMVFLAYEGVRGKPPSEGVFVTLSYLGLAFILALMIWLVGLDIGCIAR